ncbi:MAG: hypothetical protein ABSC32_02830 [Steroidobacteraceae bacterium]|jgi:hypothetical protein
MRSGARPFDLNDIGGYFRRLVEKRLPDDARVLTSFRSGDVIIQATWRLRNDPRRPAKRSRLVRIVISVEAVEGYILRGDAERLASDQRFIEWLDDRLATREQEHDEPVGAEPASIEWMVSGSILNG